MEANRGQEINADTLKILILYKKLIVNFSCEKLLSFLLLFDYAEMLSIFCGKVSVQIVFFFELFKTTRQKSHKAD